MARQNLQRFGTIVQARMGSARVPGKVLKPIKGRPLLEYVVQSLQQSRVVGELVIATSEGASDDAIAEWCNLRRVTCYRGSEQNVASRFFHLAKAYAWDAFFRVSADSPLIDHRLMDQAATQFNKQRCDLVTNVYPRTFPKGQSIELLKTEVYLKSYSSFCDAEDLEHVTRFFYRNWGNYEIVNMRSPTDWSHIHMAVDTPADWQRAKKVLGNMRQAHTSLSLQQRVALWTEERNSEELKAA